MADEDDYWSEISPEMRAFEEGRPRIEYMGTLCLLASETVLHEHGDVPEGVVRNQVLLLNVRGHLHPEYGPSCIPMELPLLLDRDDVRTLIEALTTAGVEMDKAERGER
jgi:hypothetical protein